MATLICVSCGVRYPGSLGDTGNMCSVCDKPYADDLGWVEGDTCSSCGPEGTRDAVNHPPHYTTGGMETIDVIEAKLSREEFQGYLRGNILKYLSRYNHKGRPTEDLKKAQWYLARLIESISSTK